MRQTSRPGSRTTDSQPRRRPATAKLRLHALEDRTVPSFGFGSAFGFGGTGYDVGMNVALDTSGSAYVAGMYSATVDFDPNHTNPASSHVLSATASSGNYAAKYLSDGTFQWAVDLGPNAQGGPGETIAVQGSTVYVTAIGNAGETNVAKLDAGSGAVAWITNLTSGGSSTRSGVAAGPSGSVYVTGQNAASQAFVTKLDAAGNVTWTATTAGGTAGGGRRMAVDGSGTAYVCGKYTGAVTFGATALTSWSGSQDIFVWKLGTGGNSVWAGSLGSNGADGAHEIQVDGSGNVYLTGNWGYGSTSQNNNFNPGSGSAVKLTNYGGYDGFVAKLVPGANGSLTASWAKGFGGSGWDHSTGVAVDGAGNVYSTGDFYGTVNFNPNKGPAYYLSGGGVYVSKLDAGGKFVAAAGMAGSSGSGQGSGLSIALDSSGNVYTTGAFSGTADFNPSSGTYNLSANGSQDVFVSKLTQFSPLLAAGGASAGKAAHLTAAQLRPIVAAAIDRWAAAGLDAQRLDLMRHATVTVADLGGDYLGLADAALHGIRIDDDAAGRGWFVDPTPRDDREFLNGGDATVRGRMDLVSAVAHELGHLVGLDDDHDGGHAGDVMGDSMAVGVRRLPAPADVKSPAAVSPSQFVPLRRSTRR